MVRCRRRADAVPAGTGPVGWWTLLCRSPLVAVAALCYFGVRDLTEGARQTAEANAGAR